MKGAHRCSADCAPPTLPCRVATRTWGGSAFDPRKKGGQCSPGLSAFSSWGGSLLPRQGSWGVRRDLGIGRPVPTMHTQTYPRRVANTQHTHPNRHTQTQGMPLQVQKYICQLAAMHTDPGCAHTQEHRGTHRPRCHAHTHMHTDTRMHTHLPSPTHTPAEIYTTLPTYPHTHIHTHTHMHL